MPRSARRAGDGQRASCGSFVCAVLGLCVTLAAQQQPEPPKTPPLPAAEAPAKVERPKDNPNIPVRLEIRADGKIEVITRARTDRDPRGLPAKVDVVSIGRDGSKTQGAFESGPMPTALMELPDGSFKVKATYLTAAQLARNPGAENRICGKSEQVHVAPQSAKTPKWTGREAVQFAEAVDAGLRLHPEGGFVPVRVEVHGSQSTIITRPRLVDDGNGLPSNIPVETVNPDGSRVVGAYQDQPVPSAIIVMENGEFELVCRFQSTRGTHGLTLPAPAHTIDASSHQVPIRPFEIGQQGAHRGTCTF